MATKITSLALKGIDGKGGLLKKWQETAISKHIQVTKGLGAGLIIIVLKSGKAYYYCRNPYTKIGTVDKVTLANAFKKVESLKKKTCHTSEETNRSPLVSTFYRSWIEEKRTVFKSSSTRICNFNSLFNRTIIPSGIGGLRLDEVNPKKVYDLLVNLDQTPGNKHNAITMLNQMMRNALLKGLINGNPIADMLVGSESPFKLPKRKGFKTIEPKYIFEKYFVPLKNTSIMNRIFYLYIVLSGFRFGECRYLHWSWCDFNKELIIIPADAYGANKTQTVYYKPMTIQIKTLLINWKKYSFNGISDYVFPSNNGDKPIGEDFFRAPLKQLTSRELDFHGIRKILKTWLSANGTPVNISELALQHDIRSSLEKIYDKNIYIDDVKIALQGWNDYIESQLPEEFLELIRE